MTDKLSDDERLMLARGNAADDHVRGRWYAADERGAFVAGWDAAMEYVKTKRDQSIPFCWVCRTHHRLEAKYCRAMDEVL